MNNCLIVFYSCKNTFTIDISIKIQTVNTHKTVTRYNSTLALEMKLKEEQLQK